MNLKGNLALVTSILTGVALFSSVAPAYASNQMRDISTMELVQEMGIGINLGNTMESCGDWIAQWGDGTTGSYETAWGSPIVTKELIQGYADAGFGVLRIPIAWSNMMAQDGTYTIHADWMNRVQQIVDWTLESGLYAIINIHWDNGWVNQFPENREQCMKRYTTMWTQIAKQFQDYGDRLMFESQNEELGWNTMWNQWGGTNGKAEAYQLVNTVNQKFVDVVRTSSGNNPLRHLLISGYNTGVSTTCDALFQMPNDPANRMAVSVHYYTPSTFAILEEDADWGKASRTWGTSTELNELSQQMDLLKCTYIDKEIPVIIGEYGCPKKNKDEASVRLYLSSVCKAAYERDICPVLWDVTDLHYNRKTFEMTDPLLHQAFLDITASDFLLGDATKDGKLTIADVVFLQKVLLAETTANLQQAKAIDVNKDKVLNAVDMTILKRMITSK